MTVLENKINLVLSGCNTIRLIRKNSHTLKNSALTIVTNVLMSLWVGRRVVSSANSSDINLDDSGKSLMYRMKRSGPKIDPWGTPRAQGNIK